MNTATRSLVSISCMAIGAALFLMAAIAAAEETAPWKVETREIPPPAGASAALRKSIGSSARPDVDAKRVGGPKTEAELRAFIAGQTVIPWQLLQGSYHVKIERDTIAGVPVFRVTPDEVDPAHKHHLFLHVHGGAYILGGGDSAPAEAAIVAGKTKIPAISVDYRMPPDHPFPAAVDDVVAVYKAVLKERKAKTIVLGGTSAGGGLALASALKFKELGLDPPAALYAGTPWADLTKTGDTQFTNEGIDRSLVTYDGMLEGAAELYAGDHDLKDPLISPVYGEFGGFPPTILMTGTRDLFLSDTARVHRKMRSAGVDADLHVFEGLSHAEYLSPFLREESKEFGAELAAFFKKHLGGR